MKVKSEREVAQSCPTLSDLRDCSLPGSSVHGFSRQEYWNGVPLPSPRQGLGRAVNLCMMRRREGQPERPEAWIRIPAQLLTEGRL